MVRIGTPSAQTLKELHEITGPLNAAHQLRGALTTTVTRLRHDLIMMTDDREVGRYRGAMARRKKAAKIRKIKFVRLSEADWLVECNELSGTFAFQHATSQLRAVHMLAYAQQQGFVLLDGVEGIDWFIQGWEDRINHRLRYTDDRMILGHGETHSTKHGVTATIYFNKVTVEEYGTWKQSFESLD